MRITSRICKRLHTENIAHKLFLCISSFIFLGMTAITLFTINILKTQVIQKQQQKDAAYLASLEIVYEDTMQRYSLITQNIYADTYVNILVIRST